MSEVEFGRACVQPVAGEPGRIMLTMEGPHTVFAYENLTQIFASEDEAADLFAALGLYLPLRADEREEEQVHSIFAAIGATDSPD
jgi:hypothetical protein